VRKGVGPVGYAGKKPSNPQRQSPYRWKEKKKDTRNALKKKRGAWGDMQKERVGPAMKFSAGRRKDLNVYKGLEGKGKRTFRRWGKKRKAHDVGHRMADNNHQGKAVEVDSTREEKNSERTI